MNTKKSNSFATLFSELNSNQKESLGSWSEPNAHPGKYACNICGKWNPTLFKLNRHYRTHTGEKPYTCKVCLKGFSHDNNLKVHMRTHTGEKPYKCDVCNKEFRYQNKYKLHMVTSHSEDVRHTYNYMKPALS